MKGAYEYCEVFKKPEQFGKLYLYPGSHARGDTFDIWLLPTDDECTTKPWLIPDSIEVYGRVGGQLGWTEVYGWIHRGKWQDDFENILESRKETLEKKKSERKLSNAKKKKAEEDRVKNLLANY